MKFFFLGLILSVSLSAHEMMQEALLVLMQTQLDQVEKINHKLCFSNDKLNNQFVLGILEKNSLIHALSQQLMEHFLVKMDRDEPYFSEKLEKIHSLLFFLSKVQSSLDPEWVEKAKKNLDAFSLLVQSSKTGARKPPYKENMKKRDSSCPQRGYKDFRICP